MSKNGDEIPKVNIRCKQIPITIRQLPIARLGIQPERLGKAPFFTAYHAANALRRYEIICASTDMFCKGT
jgi:hypothetical protein